MSGTNPHMENTQKKDRLTAVLTTALFHGVLLLCFLLFGLSTPLPLPEEEGVLVSLGFDDFGMGETQPLTASPPVVAAQPSVPATQAEEVVTQEVEESVHIPDRVVRPRQEPPRPEATPREPTPQAAATTPAPEPERPQPQVDQRALFPGSDQRSTASQQQGQTGTPGSQGRPEGAIDGEGSQGAGQGGVEFNLSGRRANSLPLPNYTSSAQGRVVVDIIVNRQGQVVRATAGARGTTTSNQELWRQAEEAARRARFDVSVNAPEEQRGTITYSFIRQN